MPSRPIDRITVGTRHRRDLGDITELARSIADVGLLHPVVITPDGRLIAGERRLEACKRLGLAEVPVHVVDLDDIVLGELAENICRSGFTPSELVAITEAVETLERERAQRRMTLGKLSTGSETGKTRDKLDKIAAPLGMSGRTLEKARAVVAAGKAEPEKFGPIVEEMDASGRVDRAYKRLKIERARIEHAGRIEHGCTVNDLVALAASGYRAAVIYADPAWPFATWGGDSGKTHSAPDNHYGTSPLDEITSLPVAALAADDCALLLWCTWPHVAIGTHVKIIEAWGFRPCTLGFDWIKPTASADDELRTGMGYYTRSNAEPCLLAIKGKPLRLNADVQQVVFAPLGEKHSEKPEEVRRRIERLFPGPYLELYGRKPVASWTVWGNEIPRGRMNTAEAAE